MKETVKGEETYSVTIYRASVGLPSILELDRTGTSGLPWTPVITHRVSAQCELLYVMGGTGRIAVQDRWIECREHSVVFIPTGVPLDLITQEDNKLDLLYTHFHMRDDHHYRRILGQAQYVLHELETYDDEAYLNMLALPDIMHLEPGNRVLKYLESAFDVYEAKTLGSTTRRPALFFSARSTSFRASSSALCHTRRGARNRPPRPSPAESAATYLPTSRPSPAWASWAMPSA